VIVQGLFPLPPLSYTPPLMLGPIEGISHEHSDWGRHGAKLSRRPTDADSGELALLHHHHFRYMIWS
jgi:hypothetical protein